jgi:hypothetical protein
MSEPSRDIWQPVKAALGLGLRAIEEVRALSVEVRTLARQPGPRGPAGKLHDVKLWTEGVHYEGELAFFEGSTYQARKDTARPPPHDDWALVAAKGTDGKDARDWTVRGVHNPEGNYSKGDVVTRDGGSWIAVADKPGPLPGDGWRILVQRGKAGPPGLRGEPGIQGKEGKSAPRIVGWREDLKSFSAIPVLSDGTEGAPLSLRGFFELYDDEARR